MEVWASVGRVEVWVEWAGRSASGSLGWLVRRGVGEWVGGSVYGCDLVGVGDAVGGRVCWSLLVWVGEVGRCVVVGCVGERTRVS